MRVLLADSLSKAVIDTLEDRGCAVSSDPSLRDDALVQAIARLDPDVLVVRGTKVTAAHLAAGRSLSLVIRAGAGVNTIDLGAASARGIYVSNCPGKNAIAVAELTVGHLVNLDRRIADNVIALREGRWEKGEFGKSRGLAGRTVALLGVGQIGQEVIRRLRAFDMKIKAWSRSLTPAQAEALGVQFCATPLEACRGAEALSIHLALGPETRNLVGLDLLEALRPGALVVNTSRGEVLDQPALLRAIASRGLRAGLDVFADEPAVDGAFPDPIGQNPSMYGTHHIGASTDQASEAVAEEVVRIVTVYRESGEVPNCVNIARQTPATHLLVVRHQDRVGVLAALLDVLSRAGINVQQMENIIFTGAAACARIQVEQAPSAEVMAALDAHPAVLASSLLPIER